MGGKSSKTEEPTADPTTTTTTPAPVKGVYVTGDYVKSIYGHGVVSEVRADGTVCFVLDNWFLANNQTVKCYLNPTAVDHDTTHTPSPEAIALSQEGQNLLSTFSPGDRVLTPFGKGVITEKRKADLVVTPFTETWMLANECRPKYYLHPNQCTLDPVDSPILGGEAVTTPFGSGYVLSRRPEDGQFIVESNPTNWSLANGSLARMYLAPNLVSRTAAYAGDRVLTPFGKGVVVEKRATDLVVRLHTSTWVLAYGQKPTLYLDPAIVKKDPIDSPVVGGETFIIESHVWQLANNCLPRFFLDPALVKRETDFSVGDRVLTQFGKGVVAEKRAADYVVILHTSTWVLAYGQKPTLYLAPNMLKPDPTFSPIVGSEKVSTPFGSGIVLSTDPTSKQLIVESTKWLLANNSLPRFFLDPNLFDEKELKTGETYDTSYGPAVLTSLFQDKVILQPKTWELAYKQIPRFYLNKEAVNEWVVV
ncbi:hypothetical protein TL16_g04411 [Triparma laevis f. inornata]|uniref:Uncharacterized protein n=1 Tax=Triparma laevis f. inornata TaxID=1714386 RepID=A0A9W7AEM2_9STRA|nr:hypothetical protein TL16_g04411 [Triparma laevis f. inornata]